MRLALRTFVLLAQLGYAQTEVEVSVGLFRDRAALIPAQVSCRLAVSGDRKALALIGIAPIGGKGDTQSRADVSGDLPFGPISATRCPRASKT